MHPIEFLRTQWSDLTGKRESGMEIFENLIARYSEPNRYYHNVHHIADMLQLVGRHEAQLKRADIIAWSVWYHDAIYDVTRTDNEERSAELAQQELQIAGIPENERIRIGQLIRSTQKHEPSDHTDSDNCWLLDFDLSILSAAPEKYDAYSKQIRKEYAVYSDSLYVPGRIAVLKKLLSRPGIYLTELYSKNFEDTARGNLQRELNFLMEKTKAM